MGFLLEKLEKICRSLWKILNEVLEKNISNIFVTKKKIWKLSKTFSAMSLKYSPLTVKSTHNLAFLFINLNIFELPRRSNIVHYSKFICRRFEGFYSKLTNLQALNIVGENIDIDVKACPYLTFSWYEKTFFPFFSLR